MARMGTNGKRGKVVRVARGRKGLAGMRLCFWSGRIVIKNPVPKGSFWVPGRSRWVLLDDGKREGLKREDVKHEERAERARGLGRQQGGGHGRSPRGRVTGPLEADPTRAEGGAGHGAARASALYTHGRVARRARSARNGFFRIRGIPRKVEERFSGIVTARNGIRCEKVLWSCGAGEWTVGWGCIRPLSGGSA